MSRFTVLVTGVILLLVQGSAHAQSLASELQGLLQGHPDIRARTHETEAARAAVDGAEAGYLPKLDVFGQTGPQYIDSPVLASEGGGTWFSNAQVAGARLTQPLFDGFATPAQVRTARLNLEAASYTLDGTRQNVLYDGIEAYVEVLRQRRLLALARDSEHTIARQLQLEDERVLRGAGIAVDVLQAKSRLQLAKERRIAFEGALTDAASRYIEVFDHAPDLESMEEPHLPSTFLPSDLHEALQAASQENPAIDSSLAVVAATDQRRRLARSGYYPTINVVASANHERDVDLVQGTRVDYSVLLQANWNLFDGFATSAAVSRAAQEYAASQATSDGVARKVREETRLAWHQLETAKRRVELLQNAVNIATEVFVARTRLREAGRETVINVLDAQNEVVNARINLTTASGDATLAAFRLLQGMGRLRPENLELNSP